MVNEYQGKESIKQTENKEETDFYDQVLERKVL